MFNLWGYDYPQIPQENWFQPTFSRGVSSPMNSAKDSLPSKSRSMFVKNSSTSALHGEQYSIYNEDSHDVIYLSDLQKIWTSLFWCLVIENVVHGHKYYLMHDPDYEGNLRFTQNEYQQARMFLSLVYIFRGQFFWVENGAEKLWTVLPNCSFLCCSCCFRRRQQSLRYILERQEF